MACSASSGVASMRGGYGLLGRPRSFLRRGISPPKSELHGDLPCPFAFGCARSREEVAWWYQSSVGLFRSTSRCLAMALSAKRVSSLNCYKSRATAAMFSSRVSNFRSSFRENLFNPIIESWSAWTR